MKAYSRDTRTGREFDLLEVATDEFAEKRMVSLSAGPIQSMVIQPNFHWGEPPITGSFVIEPPVKLVEF